MSSALLRTKGPPLTRLLHTSSARCNRVAPPHPISHMRPIIYDDAPLPSPPTLLRHPYSLTEFQDAQSRPVDLELQFKLQRQQLDNFHQDFWLDVRSAFPFRFLDDFLASVPLTRFCFQPFSNEPLPAEQHPVLRSQGNSPLQPPGNSYRPRQRERSVRIQHSVVHPGEGTNGLVYE